LALVKAQFEVMEYTLGERLLPLFDPFLTAITGVITAFEKLDGATGGISTTLFGAGAGVLTIGALKSVLGRLLGVGAATAATTAAGAEAVAGAEVAAATGAEVTAAGGLLPFIIGFLPEIVVATLALLAVKGLSDIVNPTMRPGEHRGGLQGGDTDPTMRHDLMRHKTTPIDWKPNRSLVDFWDSAEGGFHADPYWDVNNWRSGYGTTAGSEFEHLNEAQAAERRNDALAQARATVLSMSTVQLNDNQLDALTDLAANMGINKFRAKTPTLMGDINAGRLDKAAQDFLLYDQKYDALSNSYLADPTLHNRRAAEAERFSSKEVNISQTLTVNSTSSGDPKEHADAIAGAVKPTLDNSGRNFLGALR
jgi:GH24 family phage-related lysozyme (muramidase)